MQGPANLIRAHPEYATGNAGDKHSEYLVSRWTLGVAELPSHLNLPVRYDGVIIDGNCHQDLAQMPYAVAHLVNHPPPASSFTYVAERCTDIEVSGLCTECPASAVRLEYTDASTAEGIDPQHTAPRVQSALLLRQNFV